MSSPANMATRMIIYAMVTDPGLLRRRCKKFATLFQQRDVFVPALVLVTLVKQKGGSTLVCALFSWVQYEPELFPGLIYRMLQPKVVLLIFVSGKVVLTGECTSACNNEPPAILPYYCLALIGNMGHMLKTSVQS